MVKAGGGGFSILNEESKILKKKEKEAEREQKRQEVLAAALQAPKVSNWGDVSDDDEELDHLFKPVEDKDLSDSEKGDDSDEEAEPQRGSGGYAQPASDGADRGAPVAKANTKAKGKENKDKAEEDLDAVLKEFGVELPDEEKKESSKKSKKKKKEAQEGEDQAAAPVAKEAARSNADEPADEPAPVEDPEAQKAALDALKKKAAKGKTSSKGTSAQALAAAEAKKKPSAKKKQDKSSYDR